MGEVVSLTEWQERKANTIFTEDALMVAYRNGPIFPPCIFDNAWAEYTASLQANNSQS